MPPPRGSVVAAIVAGGMATRLGGRPKGSLPIGGRPLLERQLEALRPVFSRVIVVANEPGPWQAMGLLTVPDRHPGRPGPLAGIHAALAALRGGEEAVVCVGCDMPFLSAATLGLLVETAPWAPAVVPRVGGHAEPLFARYGRSLESTAEAALVAGTLKLQDVLAQFQPVWLEEPLLRVVDPDLLCLVNVNTEEDLVRAEALAGGLGG
jgi:molybdenum cofactor guanylyltransferase